MHCQDGRTNNLTYELEEDSELLAAELSMNREQIEEMMHFMCDLSLFSIRTGLFFLKLRDRSDEYDAKVISKSKSVRTKSGEAPEKVPPIRREKNRKEKKEPTKTTALPKNFSISDGVRSWAEKSGHRRLNAHLEHFIDKAKAKNYRYADWDAAFKTAIRQNWAGIQ